MKDDKWILFAKFLRILPNCQEYFNYDSDLLVWKNDETDFIITDGANKIYKNYLKPVMESVTRYPYYLPKIPKITPVKYISRNDYEKYYKKS